MQGLRTAERCPETTTPKIGIIGAGNMGRIHARILGGLRALCGIADTDLERARTTAEQYGVEAFQDFNTMIDRLRPDGVIVATPTSTHAEIASRVAEHECIRGILIEKPLASTLADAKRTAKILRQQGIVALVSHSEIYNPIVGRALALIREGAIGKPRTVVHDRRGFVLPDRLRSLGDVFEDIGVHDFDIMMRMSSGPASLYAQCVEDGDIYNAAVILVKFQSGTQHLFHLSRQYAGRRRAMDVSGTKGTLVLDLFAQIIKIQDLDKEPSADSRTIRLPERGTTIKVYGEPIGEVIADFIRCIETGATPHVSLDDGIAALEVVEHARESTRKGKVIHFEVTGRD